MKQSQFICLYESLLKSLFAFSLSSGNLQIEAKSNEKQLHTNLHSLLIETNRAKSTRWGNTPNAIYFKCLSLLVCQNWMRYICFIQHRMGWKQISFGASSIYKYTSVHPEVFAAALSQNKKMKSWLYFI